MFGVGAPRFGDEDPLTYMFDNHGMSPVGSGSGKSTDAANIALRDTIGARNKFLRILLEAATCHLNNLPRYETIEEYFQFLENLPQTVKFNAFWLVKLDWEFGRQKTRDVVEIYNSPDTFQDRMNELCATSREDSQIKHFVRPWNEKRSLAIVDDGDFTKSSYWMQGTPSRISNCRHLEYENTVLVSVKRCCVDCP